MSNFPKLNAIEIDALQAVANDLGMPAEWLYAEIDFESGWNPTATNPESGAKGLIQFMDATAQGMGYASAADLVESFPDRIAQLNGPVFQYLDQYKPYPTAQSVAMAVFFPAFRYLPVDTLFPSWVTTANSGIASPLDYLKRVFGPNFLPPAAIVAIVAAGVLLMVALIQNGVHHAS